MRDNRDHWRFYKHPSKPPLTAEAVRYWRNALAKLLKVGIELEFNLPEQKGTCHGDNVHCPCIHINKDCWKECVNIKECEKTPCLDTCGNRVPGCTSDQCEKCDKYELACLGTNCIEFISACFVCKNFDKNCETCPKRYDPNKDPKQIRQSMKNELSPSGSYGQVSKSGVVSITTDGSLSGDKGVEIITVGRRPDYWEFFRMSKKILTMCTDKGAFLNERCSSHMHLLTSYYDGPDNCINELEKEMPEIIAANFHQLCRRYQNAITWMTMALDDPKHMTRWEKFRVSILEISPVTKSMEEVDRQIRQKSHSLTNKEKYGWANYVRTQFNGNKLSRFHVELRVADSTLCPSYYASMACLFYALVIKAADISRYGVLKIGEEEWLSGAMRIKNAILNGTGGYEGIRVGDTTHVLEYREELTSQSFELINQLKGIIMKLGPAYDVLAKLAQQPVALRRIDGDTWEDIEMSLAVTMEEADQIEFRMNEIVDLRHIEDCRSVEEWVIEVSKIANDVEDGDLVTKMTKEDVKRFIDNKMRDGELIWSDTTGSMISL